MIRFINFLFFAISGLLLTIVAELSLLNGVSQFVAFASLITGILFYCAAAYQVFKD